MLRNEFGKSALSGNFRQLSKPELTMIFEERQANAKAAIILQRNITRCLIDKHPGYDRDVAVYNDLLKEISPKHAFVIEYDGKDARIIS